MPGRRTSILLALSLFSLSLGLTAYQRAQEAPAAFATPTLSRNPGSESVSNGIAEPPGDTYALDQARFEQQHDGGAEPALEGGGLGPVFNATSCGTCHQNVVTGAASQITEVRAGHLDANGHFANPTIPINGGANAITGRSIINDRSTCEAAHESLPATETVHSLRAVLNTLGDGFVEAVSDHTLLEIAARQARLTNGMIHGEAVMVPVLEAPSMMKVGRFGWKDQQPTVLSFSADAYLNEMGVTSRLRPVDVTTICKQSTAIEDIPDHLGMADIDHFAQFIRGTQAPPRDTELAQSADAIGGERLFAAVGCSTCHINTLVTEPAGTPIVPGVYNVPEAIGNREFHPFSDFLLHDIGTGDGIVQGGPADTANKLRTAPLWGLHIKSRFMHDLASLTVEDAIARHSGEARQAREQFSKLDAQSQRELTTFLRSL